MSKLNKTVEKVSSVNTSDHLNFMGGESWDIYNPFLKLRIMAASSFFGEPKFYKEDDRPTISKGGSISIYNFKNFIEWLGESFEERQLKTSEEAKSSIEKIIDECLNKDIEETLKIAVALRNEDNIRATPQVILVRAAVHKNSKGTGLITKYIGDICKRGDEPANELAYFFNTYGKDTSIPNSLKKGLKKILESLNEYQLSKYRMESHEVKTVDVVNLTHAYSEAIDKLCKGNLKQENTWNNIVSNADKKMSKTEIWTKAAEGMPHMALLRNLRNLIENDVDPKLYVNKLKNGVEHGKQLPFRYYTAYIMLKNNNKTPSIVLDTLEECLEISFKNAPHFEGKTACLSDNSGSAWGSCTSELGVMEVAKIGNMMGVMTSKMSDDGSVFIFGDKLKEIPVRKKQSIFDLCNKCEKTGKNIGHGTENGIWLFFKDAIENKKHYDQIFVYSDMQAGTGELYGFDPKKYENFALDGRYINVAKLIAEYRKQVNKDVMVYLVQTAGYSDVLVPNVFNKTFILGGWSQNIPIYAKKMSEIFLNK